MKPISERVLKRGKRLVNQLSQVIDDLEYKTTIHQIKSKLSPVLSKYAIHLCIAKDRSLLKNEIIVSGSCTFDLPTPEITMTLTYSDKLISLSSELKELLINELTSSVVHELTHREQIKITKGVGLPEYDEVQYLTQHHEISAFSNDISIELWLTDIKISDIEFTPTYLGIYRDSFALNSKELKRLLKNIYRNLVYLNELGHNLTIKEPPVYSS